MSNARTTIALAAITTFNLFGVGLGSLLAIHGDGSAGGLYWILGLGVTWVVAFAYRAVRLANQGEHKAAISLAAKTLPYALLVIMCGEICWVIIAGLR